MQTVLARSQVATTAPSTTSPEASTPAQSSLRKGRQGWVNALATALALFGWYIFALLGSFSPAGTNVGMTLVLLAGVLSAPELWRTVRREPVFWLALLLTLYTVARSWLAIQQFPAMDEMQNPHWTHFLRMAGLIALLMGWWLYRKPRHLYLLLWVALLGLLVGVAAEGQLDHLLGFDFSSRHVWGYSPNYLAMVSGAGMLALLAWLLKPTRERVRARLWLPSTALLVVLTVMLVTSQSRAGWLAFLFGGAALLAGLLVDAHRRQRSLRMPLLTMGAFLLMAGGLLTWFFGDLIVQRLGYEWGTVTAFLEGDFQSVMAAGGPIGIRAELWSAGLRAFWEQPLFGWGVGAGEAILRGPAAQFDQRHFHNLYLEVLVSLGLAGFLMAFGVILLLMRAAWQACQAGVISPTLAIGLLAVTVHAAVMLNFELRIGQTEGRAALTLLMSIYAYILFQWRAARTGYSGNRR